MLNPAESPVYPPPDDKISVHEQNILHKSGFLQCPAKGANFHVRSLKSSKCPKRQGQNVFLHSAVLQVLRRIVERPTLRFRNSFPFRCLSKLNRERRHRPQKALYEQNTPAGSRWFTWGLHGACLSLGKLAAIWWPDGHSFWSAFFWLFTVDLLPSHWAVFS